MAGPGRKFTVTPTEIIADSMDYHRAQSKETCFCFFVRILCENPHMPQAPFLLLAWENAPWDSRMCRSFLILVHQGACSQSGKTDGACGACERVSFTL